MTLRRPCFVGGSILNRFGTGTLQMEPRNLFMPSKALHERMFRIQRGADGRFETRNEVPTDSPMGVEVTLGMAIGTATREATLASREGCRVIIEVLEGDGTWKRANVIHPPIPR